MIRYPNPPQPDACEWNGTQIGISNMITREREIDSAVPEFREDFDALREQALRALAGFDAHIHDAVFLGLRVRLFTNSHHLADFWRETTFSVADWKRDVGTPLPAEPVVTLNAIINQPALSRKTFVSPNGRDLLVLNTSHFETFRRAAYAAIFPQLLQREILPIRASAVVRDGHAHVLIGATGSGKTRLSLRLLTAGAGWLADQAVAIRFDASGPLAFPLERRACLPVSLCRTDPKLLPVLLRSRLENIPDATDALRREHEEAVQQFRSTAGSSLQHFLGYLSADAATALLVRFIGSPSGHAIVDPAARCGRSAAPMARISPIPVTGVTLLERAPAKSSFPEILDPARFLTALAATSSIRGSSEVFANPARLQDEAAFARSIRAMISPTVQRILEQAPPTIRTEAQMFARLAESTCTQQVNVATTDPESIAAHISFAPNPAGV